MSEPYRLLLLWRRMCRVLKSSRGHRRYTSSLELADYLFKHMPFSLNDLDSRKITNARMP